jgi:hypothetical protein
MVKTETAKADAEKQPPIKLDFSLLCFLVLNKNCNLSSVKV